MPNELDQPTHNLIMTVGELRERLARWASSHEVLIALPFPDGEQSWFAITAVDDYSAPEAGPPVLIHIDPTPVME